MTINFQETFHKNKHIFKVNSMNHLSLSKVLVNFVQSDEMKRNFP